MCARIWCPEAPTVLQGPSEGRGYRAGTRRVRPAADESRFGPPHPCTAWTRRTRRTRAPGCGPGGRGFESPRSPFANCVHVVGHDRWGISQRRVPAGRGLPAPVSYRQTGSRSTRVPRPSRRGSAATSSSGSTFDADQTSSPTRSPVCSSSSRRPQGCSSDRTGPCGDLARMYAMSPSVA